MPTTIITKTQRVYPGGLETFAYLRQEDKRQAENAKF